MAQVAQAAQMVPQEQHQLIQQRHAKAKQMQSVPNVHQLQYLSKLSEASMTSDGEYTDEHDDETSSSSSSECTTSMEQSVQKQI
jgi:hypothetical protein